MSKKTLKFPAGFLWGAATSAHQVEGGNVNEWSEWEKKNAKQWTKKARRRWKKWQQEMFPEMFDSKNYISGQSCDHYHLFEKDFDLAKSLGHNAYRFSIEWSRIEPKEGKIDQKEIEHYRQVLLALKERGFEPFVTLYHWTVPIWFSRKGGWLNPKASYYFDRFAKIVSQNLFEQVNFWITLNEAMLCAGASYLRGTFPPQGRNIFKFLKAINNLAKAHQLAYRSLHLIDIGCQVGIAKHNIYFKNLPLAEYFWNNRFVNKIKDEQDFIGLNYYKQHQFPKKKNLPVSDLGWGIYPKGIYYLLKDLQKYQKPIYITENGLADAQDAKRTKFIKDHLYWIHKAIKEDVDVRGYFYWSLLDNFEWDKGFWPRFGLIEVDYQTLKRIPRPSAYQYAKICRENALKL